MATEELVRDVLLRDGSTLRLRAPKPDDLDAIKAFYDELSPKSRYMRFHGFGAPTWRRARARRRTAPSRPSAASSASMRR